MRCIDIKTPANLHTAIMLIFQLILHKSSAFMKTEFKVLLRLLDYGKMQLTAIRN